jgi:hypothetical protein
MVAGKLLVSFQGQELLRDDQSRSGICRCYVARQVRLISCDGRPAIILLAPVPTLKTGVQRTRDRPADDRGADCTEDPEDSCIHSGLQLETSR